MKKIIICFVFSLFVYGCSEINEPIQVKENNSVTKVLNDQNNLIQNKPVIKDSTVLNAISDSGNPGPVSLIKIVKILVPQK